MIAPRSIKRRVLHVAGATLAMFATAAIAAQAGHWWWSTSPTAHAGVVHVNAGHHPGFGFWNGADEDAEVRLRFEYTRGHWNREPFLTMGEVADPAAAQVRAHDGWFGATNWAGLATPMGWDGYHAAYMDVTANLTYMQTPRWTNTWQYKQAVACHEVGHAVAGIGDQTGPDASCMAVGYAAVSGEWNTDQRYRIPSDHDKEHIGHLWGTLH